ncbi:MAG: TonB-dependent receptor [Bacteroidales bacterium]|nr:TonB-dependent receptor [Bacteroidales bacterium]MCF8332923.1 TonB-dependent receptor [Bacteroidales bacterium]
MKRRPKLILVIIFSALVANTFAQKTITGKVTNKATGNSLPGVTVLAKETNNGTITDEKGQYSLEVSDKVDTLRFTFMGMKPLEKKIGNKTTINARMEETKIALDEYVVVGYGSVKKSDLTGSVSSIKTEKLEKIPVNTMEQKLQGQSAGVRLTQLSHQPGGETSIRVRGGNSILAGNEPLYVIDGVPVSQNTAGLSSLSAPVQSGISGLNPNDIESIEILKDASATAIYGARGANGVVLITTKSGKAGEDKISFEAYTGFQQKASSIDVMNATQYAKLYDEAGANASENYTPEYPNPESLGEGTDWPGRIYRQAPMQNYELSISGGNETTRYALSGGYYDREGIIYGSDFQRYSFRANLEKDVSDRLKVGSHLSMSHTKSNVVGSDTQGGFFPGVVNTSLVISPTMDVYDEDGNYTITDPVAEGWYNNPVAVTRERDAVNKIKKLMGDAYAEYTLLDALTLKSSLGVDITQQVQDMYTPRFIYEGSWNNGQARYATNNYEMFNFENTLTYDKQINEQHKLNALLGFSYQETDNRAYINIATGFPNDILGYYGISNAEDMPKIRTGFNKSSLISYFARTNYNLKDKYLLTLTGRVDGSSKFGENNRFGFFPSAALAWRLSQEEFIEQLDVFSNLKFRMSYGLSGNERISNFQYIRTIASTTYYMGETPATGFAPDQPGNNNLKWETTQQLDIGFDMGFFNNRLTVTTDYYYKKTVDLLYYADLPWITGFNSVMDNIGSMENEGFELEIHSDNFVNDFKWSTDFNISTNRNQILDLKGNELYVNNDQYKLKIGNWAVIREGEEMGSFYGWEADGIWQLEEAEQAAAYDAEPGDFKYVDQNDDGKLNEKDRQIVGHALPDFRWGLTNTFSYRNFALDVFLQGVHGNDILNANRFELESGNGLTNASTDMLDRWTPENPSDTYPRANRNADFLHMSDRYLEDGSYIRLKSVTLSFSIPESWRAPLKIEKASLYVTAKNLLTITDYSGFDPEVGHFGQDNRRVGYDYGAYPSVRTYILGLKFNF